MKIYLHFVLLVLFASSHSLAQPAFEYRSKINAVDKEGWYSITIPATAFKNISYNYADLRIYKITGNDTLETPYLLKVKNDEVNEGIISLPVLNNSKREGKLFLTFQLKKEQAVNYLDLNFEEQNFNGYVKLEGSNDQKEWFEVVDRQRILSILNQDVDFNALTLNFPLTNYRYLRAAVSSDKPLTLSSASFRTKVVKAGKFLNANAKPVITQDKKSKQTIVEVTLKEFQPISKLSVTVNHQGDYYRSFSLEKLRDSTLAPNKTWTYYYDPIYSGYLTSVKANDFEFDATAIKKIRITIFNADNTPLAIENILLKGPQVELVAQLTPGDFYLFYGNNALTFPSYDLVHFKNQIPDSTSSVQLQPEEKLTPENEKVSPLVENQMWLWIAMGGVILLLGFATLKMMSKK